MYELMFAADMFTYYRIFPKAVFIDFAILYVPPDFAEELKVELEAILGMTLKFEILPENKIMSLISENKKGEEILIK